MSDDLQVVTTTKALTEAMKQGDTDVNAGKHYSETRPVARVRDQYVIADVAKKYLDDMEAGGRLHGRRARPKK